MNKSIYAGFTVGNVPGVSDPHITLVFIDITEDRDIRPNMTGDEYHMVQNQIWKLWKAIGKKKFIATAFHVEYFGENGDVPVVIVDLPDQILELAKNFRAALYHDGIVYSTRFPFRPHVTVTNETLTLQEIREWEFEVTGLFIDNGDERKTLHLQ